MGRPTHYAVHAWQSDLVETLTSVVNRLQPPQPQSVGKEDSGEEEKSEDEGEGEGNKEGGSEEGTSSEGEEEAQPPPQPAAAVGGAAKVEKQVREGQGLGLLVGLGLFDKP